MNSNKVKINVAALKGYYMKCERLNGIKESSFLEKRAFELKLIGWNG